MEPKDLYKILVLEGMVVAVLMDEAVLVPKAAVAQKVFLVPKATGMVVAGLLETVVLVPKATGMVVLVPKAE